MSQNLLQIKVEAALKEKLQRVARLKGLNLSNYIRMVLIDSARKEAQYELTENGFTKQEEASILTSIKAGEDEIQGKTTQSYDSVTEAIQSLES